jgi:hypothetical protein
MTRKKWKHRGLRQVWGLSPRILIIYFENILKTWKKANPRGIRLNSNFKNIRYSHIIFTVHSLLYNIFYFNQHMHYNFVVIYTSTYVSTTY